MAEVDAEFQAQIRKAFDALSDEQKRNVLNWGNPNGLTPPESSPSISFPKTDFPALYELKQATGKLNENAEFNRATADMLLGRNGETGLTTDPYLKIYPKGEFGGLTDLAGSGVNLDAVEALSSQMHRLSGLYPGTMSRMENYLVGHDPERQALAWFRPGMPNPGRIPGEMPYEIGSPAQATFLRQVMGQSYHPNTGELMTSQSPVSADDFHAYNSSMYDSQLQGTMAHELGHATQHTMRDFVSGLSEDSPARQAFDQMTSILGTAGPGNQAISGYARQASSSAMQRGLGQFRASEEPFAELFSVARSPQGFDIGSSNLGVQRAALNDIVGGRSPQQAATLLDRVGVLNHTEKALRNEGFGEVGGVAPELAMQIGLPALAGLIASKTHGNVKAALSGAAAGGAIGGLAGPEGTLVGAGLGAGANLVRQLL